MHMLVAYKHDSFISILIHVDIQYICPWRYYSNKTLDADACF